MQVEERIREKHDFAFEHMHSLAKIALLNNKANRYHQAKRDAYAVERDLFYKVNNVDILMVLDGQAT